MVLKLSSEGYGILLTCLGIGLCFGALLLGKRIGKLNYNQILLIGFSLISLTTLWFLFGPNFFVSVFLLVLGGAGASLIMVTLDSLLQRASPNYLRANIFGARGIITNAIFLFGLIVVGKLLKIFNVSFVFGIIGITSFGVTFIIYLSRGDLGYRLLRGIIKLVLKIFFQLKVEGLKNLPAKNKLILAGNHTSLLDGLIVMAAYSKRIYFLVAESIFKHKMLGFFARQLGFIPVKPGGLNKEAIQEAVRILETRNAIGIFPEGRITDDETPIKGKRGVALIAQKTDTAIVPFAIEGAYYAWPRFKKYPRRHPVKIRFGKPLNVKGYKESQEVVDEVMEAVAKMKVEMEKEGLLEVEPNVIVRHLINFG